MAISYFEDAITAFEGHEAVLEIVGKQQVDDGSFVIEARFNTKLPSRWARAGESPDGVRASEVIEVTFPADYPNCAPHFSLRQDFNSKLPHINPHRSGERIPPCILAGSQLELLHTEGLSSLINQMAEWLKNAGRSSLINLDQGWEPARRDNVKSFISMDPEEVLQPSQRHGQHQLYSLRCWRAEKSNAVWAHHYKRWPAASVTEAAIAKMLDSTSSPSDGLIDELSLMAVCWPSATSTGEPAVHDQYLPDNVTCVADLTARADELDCKKAFQAFSSNLNFVAKKLHAGVKVSVFVVFPIRRPAKVIGFNSEYEYLAYKVDAATPKMFEDDASTTTPVAFLNRTNEALLRRTSGVSLGAQPPTVTFLGCGSVGSKLAMHSARSGFAPALLIDHEWLAPHNVARHALLPRHCTFQTKAKALAKEIETFGLKRPQVSEVNIIRADIKKEPVHAKLFDSAALLVNTTGSHSVRQFLHSSEISARVLEGCLTFKGQAGIFLSEGEHRNPSCADLMSVAYDLLRENNRLASPMDPSDMVLQVGVGCNSVTLPMSDTRVSLLSAGMSQALFDAQTHGLPVEGCVSVGLLGDDGMSVDWRHQIVGKTQLAAVSGLPGWTVRVLDVAHRKILEDVSCHPGVESGGLIVGRCSPTHREVTIVDVLDAPPDSLRQADKFVLGVEQLAETITAYDASAENVLWCMGTWHSHLLPSGPSDVDMRTAKDIEGLLKGAVVMLIKHPGGYAAIVGPGLDS